MSKKLKVVLQDDTYEWLLRVCDFLDVDRKYESNILATIVDMARIEGMVKLPAQPFSASYILPDDHTSTPIPLDEGSLTNNSRGGLSGTHKGVDLPSGSLVFMYGRFVGVIK